MKSPLEQDEMAPLEQDEMAPLEQDEMAPLEQDEMILLKPMEVAPLEQKEGLVPWEVDMRSHLEGPWIEDLDTTVCEVLK